MARHKTPKNILKISPSAKKHPERLRDRKNEADDPNDIGDPPKHLNRIQKKYFREIVNTCVPGVLRRSDTLAVEQAAMLLYKLRGHVEVDGTTVEASPAEQQLLFKYYAQFGMNPTCRRNVSAEKPEDKDSPFADY
jgi:phage terminase small subunit